MKEYAYKGQFLGGIVPLGVDLDEKKHFIINEFEAETVRIIYRMKLAGFGYGAIIGKLAEDGRLTKKGRPFGKNSLHEILKNEKYIGNYVYNKAARKINGKMNNRIKRDESEVIRIKGAFPAIISYGDWLVVQSKMNEKKRNARQVENSPYILTGVLRCGFCGGAMTGHTQSKNNAKGERVSYRYYRCCTSARGAGECEHKTTYLAGPLEEKVLWKIEDNAKKVKEFTEILWEEIRTVNNDYDKEQIQVKKQLAAVDKKLRGYYEMIENGAKAEYVVQPLNEAGELKKKLEAKLSQNRSPFEGVTKKQVQDLLEAQKNLVVDRSNIEECKKTITNYIESVTALGKDKEPDILLKYQIGMSEHGRGGAVLLWAYKE